MDDQKQEALPENAIPTQVKKSPVIFRLAFFLGIISFLVYANTLKNGFAYDDFIAIKDNQLVTKGIHAIPKILSTPYLIGCYKATNDHYKPLSLVMFAVEYQLFDGKPPGSHFINVILFAFCVILLFLFLDALFDHKKTTVAFIAALLFALHPVQTEVVANIKSRDQLLCFFFGFFALNVFIRYVQSGKIVQLITGSFLFFLSLISKETTITFLAVFPLVFFFYSNENKERSIYLTISTVITALIFLYIRQAILNTYNIGNHGDYSLTDNMLASAPSMASRFATAIFVMGNYIRLLIIPYPLICDYSYHNVPFVNFTNIWVILSLMAYVLISFSGIFLLMKGRKSPFAFALLFFLITLSIYTNIVLLIGAVMAERFLFFPSVGYCLVIALLIEKLFAKTTDAPTVEVLKTPMVLRIIIPICLVYAALTINRNKDWSDDYTLFKTDVAKAPDNSRLNARVGEALLDNGPDFATQQENFKKALPYSYKAIAIDPEFDIAENDIGYEYFKLSQYDSSEVHYKRAWKMSPKSILINRNMALLYFTIKKYPQSIEFNKKNLEITPDNATIWVNIGITYIFMGKYDSAINCSNVAISVDSNYNISYENLAVAYKALGNLDSLKKYEGIARLHNPGFNP